LVRGRFWRRGKLTRMRTREHRFVPGLIPFVLDDDGFKEAVIFCKPVGGSLVGRCFTCGRQVVHGRSELAENGTYGRRAAHCGCPRNVSYRMLLPVGAAVDGWASVDEMMASRQEVVVG
jgi:hypothetical protein